MVKIFPKNKFYLSNSKIPDGGRGVFASIDIKKGEIIEIAPILILNFDDFIDTKWNVLFEYYFWLDDCVVLALGYGSLYNHSKAPNAKYEINIDNKIITFIAIREIKKDEEILFDYSGSSNSKAPLWFER